MSANDSETVVEAPAVDDLDTFRQELYGEAPKEEVSEEPEDISNVEETDADAEPEAGLEEGDEEEDDVLPESEPEAKKPNRKTAKERISELSAKNRDKDALIAELQAKLADREAPKEEPARQEVVQPVAAEGRPDPDAKDENGELKYPLGKFDPDFITDTVEWTIEVKQKEADAKAEAKAKATELEKAQAELFTSWETKIDEFKADVPDFTEKVVVLQGTLENLEPTFGQYIAETIMTLDRGPEVLLYLADNPGEAEAIVASGPRAATIALGQIHGRLPSKEKSESNKRVSKAPNPPASMKGTAAASRITPDTDNLEDFRTLFYKEK